MEDVMKQINLETRIEKNKLFELLKPIVFEDEKHFCCVYGNDLRFGVKGFGHTPEEAIEDWEWSIMKRIKYPFKNDAIAYNIVKMLHQGGEYAATG